MLQSIARPGPNRRAILFAGAAALAPLPTLAAGVCTPQDLSRRYATLVDQRLDVPFNEACIYAALAESELTPGLPHLGAPQYLLVVDSCPDVQAAFLFWRLMPTQYELVGASPASTGCAARPGHLRTPLGAYPQAGSGAAPGHPASRVYDFGVHRARRASGGFAPLHLQARAAWGGARSRLGTAQSDGCVLLPPALVAFLDQYGVLDTAGGERVTPAGELMPFAGRYLVVVDSEREERPPWAA